jgi:hypothetical protein
MAFAMRRIDLPSWANARDQEVAPEPDGPIVRELYRAVQVQRDEFLLAVHRAVVAHVDCCALDDPRPGIFPKRSLLTGDYYLSRRETYSFRERADIAHVVVHARCLGRDEFRLLDEPDDYLGIDVSVEFDPTRGTFQAEAFSLQVICSDRALASWKAEHLPKVEGG